MTDKPKQIVAVLGGGDWYDASVDFYEIPADCDLEALEKAYNSQTGKRKLRVAEFLEKHGGTCGADVYEWENR